MMGGSVVLHRLVNPNFLVSLAIAATQQQRLAHGVVKGGSVLRIHLVNPNYPAKAGIAIH